MKTFIVPATLTIIALVFAAIENRISIYKIEQKIRNLEISKVVDRPFFRDVTVEESQLMFEYTLAVRQIQDGGFKLSHIVQGTHGISVYFIKGNETLSKIIMLKK
jgi:hypothetical protein